MEKTVVLIFHSHNDDNKLDFKYSLLLTYTEPVNSQRCIVIPDKRQD